MFTRGQRGWFEPPAETRVDTLYLRRLNRSRGKPRCTFRRDWQQDVGRETVTVQKSRRPKACVDETVRETDTHFQDSFQCFSYCFLRLVGSGVFDLFACRCREQSLLYSDMCRRGVQCRVWAPARRSLDLDFSVTVLTSVYPSKTPDPLPAGQLLCLFLHTHKKNRLGLIQKRAWKYSIFSILLKTCF